MLGPTGRPVVFGEVLFDCFEDGDKVLGGAPFNVAWHLAGFGADPVFVSRVGSDSLGERVVAAMGDWGMDVRGVQRDPAHPTGSVQVALTDGQPEFRILPDQAYDYIDAATVAGALRGVSPALLYHGSLSTRNRISRKTLEGLRAAGIPAFVDINLRAPWWTREGLDALLQGTRWLKLSDGELAALTDPEAADGADPVAATRALRGRYGCELVIVTQGEDGGLFVGPDGDGRIESAEVPVLVDSVGAGDAFSAVTILGLLRGWTLAPTFERAAAFAAHICGIRGATTRDRGLYDELLARWEGA
ncbi:2-dehydro-3-deoxygluconokinase [bacterium BMS3Bbin12]|nr:2-dehydro-3-deoxygluconokinase [bacterium BMS3Abin12]GBE47475.1 2-dehydro-3-deoxygluconokinase [bacterium BMS3Bbin12]GBE51389.1 2-dehydro-3-deoxygluconokinase [bacterium BMS3Bbin13]HDJ85723.1 carbohydrate kinase [Chromatiales bacterium]HDK03780.1 carbohydrate kinase [Gammaproteobacteria bacterium]